MVAIKDGVQTPYESERNAPRRYTSQIHEWHFGGTREVPAIGKLKKYNYWKTHTIRGKYLYNEERKTPEVLYKGT